MASRTVDLGKVVGPAGPNEVSSSTDTALNGVLVGNGSKVGVKVLDTSSLTNDSNHVPTSGVVKSAITNAVVANPTLAGTEADLTALQVGNTKYKIPSGGAILALAVTVTNGTATSVVATKGSDSVSLTYSSGAWNTMLPSFGTWTVTITDGTHSNSATVNASTAGIYTVSIYMPDVPSAYTQLEYIEGNGTQYINTGYYPKLTTSIEMKMAYPDLNNISAVGIGYLTNPNRNYSRASFGANAANAEFYFNVGIASLILLGIAKDTNPHIFKINVASSTGQIDDQTPVVATGADFEEQTQKGFPIGGFATNNTYAAREVRSYYLIVKESGTTVHKYYPAKRKSDNVLGVYDTVTNAFLTNSGTGTFIAGPAV